MLSLVMLFSISVPLEPTAKAASGSASKGNSSEEATSEKVSSEDKTTEINTTQKQNATTSMTEATTQTVITTTETTTTETVKKPRWDNTKERNAMWISYLDFEQGRKTKKKFLKLVQKMFDDCVNYGMNTVVVQVRPNGDAFYPSDYFPWAEYLTGKQGKEANYDPMEILVEEAHKRKLCIEAWINPYRLSNTSTNYNKLSKDNQARIWHSKKATRRNVLAYNGWLYYNPSKKAVRNLVINGIKEIVTNYDVDGIHMDDYFYPTFSKYNYKKAFDAPEYKAYVKEKKANGESYKSIANWRRNNVNMLIKEAYNAIKAIDSTVEFGISPAGNIQNLKSKYGYYVDIDAWMSTPGYVDYICPQIYWGFQYGQYSYDKVLKKWQKLAKKGNTKLYVGLAVYRTVESGEAEWRKDKKILSKMVTHARQNSSAKGFYYFRYASFKESKSQKAVKNLVKVIK